MIPDSDSLFLIISYLFSGSRHQHRLPGSMKQGEMCHAGTAPSCCGSEETTSGQMQQLHSVALSSPQKPSEALGQEIEVSLSKLEVADEAC